MSTWSSPTKTRFDNPLRTESYDIILRENGEYILGENDSQNWVGENKNQSTWSSPSKTTTDFYLLIDNNYMFLIDDSYKLILGYGNYDWNYQIKN